MHSKAQKFKAPERINLILFLIRKNGYVSVEELVKKTGVKRMTIWRDLTRLEEEKLITKIHGGAILFQEKSLSGDLVDLLSAPELPFEEKLMQESLKKQIIARYCAMELVKDGDTIYIDSGTTTFEMLPHLYQREIKIITCKSTE